MENIKELLIIALPILTGLLGVHLQKLWLKYKTEKFKLIDHPLFTNLILSIRDLKGWLPMKNRIVFIDALIIKLKCWVTEGEILAKELQKNNYSNLQLQNKVLKWTSNVIDKYTIKWLEEGIPQIVIDRISSIHEERVQQFLVEIKSISYSNDRLPFKMQKAIAIFDTLRLLLADTKNDFNKLVYREKYNGMFKNISYKGIPINDDEYKKYMIKNKNKQDG